MYIWLNLMSIWLATPAFYGQIHSESGTNLIFIFSLQGAVKVMAKDLIRTRHQITKFYALKSQLQGVALRIQVILQFSSLIYLIAQKVNMGKSFHFWISSSVRFVPSIACVCIWLPFAIVNMNICSIFPESNISQLLAIRGF